MGKYSNRTSVTILPLWYSAISTQVAILPFTFPQFQVLFYYYGNSAISTCVAILPFTFQHFKCYSAIMVIALLALALLFCH